MEKPTCEDCPYWFEREEELSTQTSECRFGECCYCSPGERIMCETASTRAKYCCGRHPDFPEWLKFKAPAKQQRAYGDILEYRDGVDPVRYFVRMFGARPVFSRQKEKAYRFRSMGEAAFNINEFASPSEPVEFWKIGEFTKDDEV